VLRQGDEVTVKGGLLQWVWPCSPI
jgi:hypothetical protein